MRGRGSGEREYGGRERERELLEAQCDVSPTESLSPLKSGPTCMQTFLVPSTHACTGEKPNFAAAPHADFMRPLRAPTKMGFIILVQHDSRPGFRFVRMYCIVKSKVAVQLALCKPGARSGNPLSE